MSSSHGPESFHLLHHRIHSRARRGRIEDRNAVQVSHFHRSHPRLSPLFYVQASSCRHQNRLRSRAIHRRGMEEAGPGRRRHPPVRRSGNATRLDHAGDGCAKKYSAVLREQPYEVDPDTENPEIASAWIGFSSSGEVTAPVVYAHSGNPEDYELLRRQGIDVKGKIVWCATRTLQLPRIQGAHRTTHGGSRS